MGEHDQGIQPGVVRDSHPQNAAPTTSDQEAATANPVAAEPPVSSAHNDSSDSNGDTQASAPDTGTAEPFPDSWALLAPRHQYVVIALLILGLTVLAIDWGWRQSRYGRMIHVDREFQPRHVQWRVDLNQADWPELTLLPGISETMARRITEDRQQHGPFSSPADLQRVDGIGPLTTSRLLPLVTVGAATHTEATGASTKPAPGHDNGTPTKRPTAEPTGADERK